MKNKPTVQIQSADEETCTVDFKGMRVYGMPINNQTKNQMNKVSKESMAAKIISKVFHKIGEKTTLCVLTMQNGFEVMGESSCVDPKNFDKEIGERISFENAFEKLWPLEGYLLQEKLNLKSKFQERNPGFIIHPDEALNYKVLDDIEKQDLLKKIVPETSPLETEIKRLYAEYPKTTDQSYSKEDIDYLKKFIGEEFNTEFDKAKFDQFMNGSGIAQKKSPYNEKINQIIAESAKRVVLNYDPREKVLMDMLYLKKENEGSDHDVENPARNYCLDREASIFKSLFIDNKIKGQERFEKMKLLFDRMFPHAPAGAFGVSNGHVFVESKPGMIADYVLGDENSKRSLFLRMFPNATQVVFDKLEGLHKDVVVDKKAKEIQEQLDNYKKVFQSESEKAFQNHVIGIDPLTSDNALMKIFEMAKKGIVVIHMPDEKPIHEKMLAPAEENADYHIKLTKAYRKNLDEILQSIKGSRRQSRERSLVITKIQEAIMWLTDELKSLEDGK